jgi:C4-dicarboxylate-specific signal transduction histidine kinase
VKQGQLESLNRSLEERIATTLSELREKDQILIQQGRLAAMGDMISNIAHQWRNPLNNVALIIQNLQLMSESGELTAEAMTREVGCAMDIITFMSRTIDDFRNFFRQDKEKSRFVVNRAVEDAIRLLSPGLASRGIRIELEAEGDVTALGYANEYAQVILNVINNARDVLTERHIVNPLVTIRIFRTEQRSVVLIRDNAGGIGEAILPKLFDPYFTTKAQGQGTGIGLYMSKVIIEQHMDGRILAGNVEGGAEFSIEV